MQPEDNTDTKQGDEIEANEFADLEAVRTNTLKEHPLYTSINQVPPLTAFRAGCYRGCKYGLAKGREEERKRIAKEIYEECRANLWYSGLKKSTIKEGVKVVSLGDILRIITEVCK